MLNWSLAEAYSHLQKDPVLNAVINYTGKLQPEPREDLYLSLLSSIISQQLSVKAAATIRNRFLDLFPDKYPHAEIILRVDNDRLRAVGLSYQKAGYLKNIAQFSISNTLDYDDLSKLDNESLINHLTLIKGVGRWTAEMILIFSLNRPDVFPVDDLGIQHGMVLLYGFEEKGKSLHAAMTETSLPWAPYRSLVSRHLWRYKDQRNEE